MTKQLSDYGFISAAWKRGLVIGIITLQSIAIVALFNMTVSKAAYRDLQTQHKDLERKYDICQYTVAPQLMETKRMLEDVKQKVDTASTVLEATQTNLKSLKNKANAALNK